MEDEEDVEGRVFYNAVRENIIWLLLFILLYVTSYAIICAYRRKIESEDYYTDDYDDAVIYKIAIWICTLTLAVSFGAVLLLPMSIVANEAILVFPNSYYLQWVNSSLILGLWNLTFLCSNLCLFVLLPFAYLFTESEGLPGSKKSVLSRVKETVLVLILFTVVVCGIAWVVSALLDTDTNSRQALFDVWNFYLPYLYSCISLLGVVTLLICTPVGFARMFTVTGDTIVRPQFRRNLDEEHLTASLEEQALQRRISALTASRTTSPHVASHSASHTGLANGNGHVNDTEELFRQMADITKDRLEIEKRRQVSSLRRNLGYPLVIILLLALTAICLLMVTQNSLQLLIGLKALPVETKDFVLGEISLSTLGPLGAMVEILLIFYLMLASVVGLYSLPPLRRLKPRRHDTPMTHIIVNCATLLVLSSALPVLSRTLGLTNFDLMGHFLSIEWLGNWTIILSYNIVFGVSTALCITTKFTVALRRELFSSLQRAFRQGSQRTISTSSTTTTTTNVSPNPSTTLNGTSSSTAVVNGESSHLKNE